MKIFESIRAFFLRPKMAETEEGEARDNTLYIEGRIQHQGDVSIIEVRRPTPKHSVDTDLSSSLQNNSAKSFNPPI
jgi:hypothetical protein